MALELREVFGQLGLEGFPKTSGSKGMQVYVPLNTPTTYDRTKPFARAVAQLLERRDRKLVVSEMAKSLRTGKVFVDWSQNDEHKTTVGVYSLRAREQPTVSTPLTWEEVEEAAERATPTARVHLRRRARAGGRARRPVRARRDARAGAPGALGVRSAAGRLHAALQVGVGVQPGEVDAEADQRLGQLAGDAGHDHARSEQADRAERLLELGGHGRVDLRHAR